MSTPPLVPSQRATLIGLSAVLCWSALVSLFRSVAEHLGAIGGAACVFSLSALLVTWRFGLPRAPRISRAEAQSTLSPVQLSFMSESRRLSNRRIKTELKAQLRFPQVADGIDAAWRERNV